MFARQFARRGLTFGHCIMVSAWIGGSTLYCFCGWLGGVIVPLLFYAAPCCTAVLGVETRLIELDRVMTLASRMDFGLERSDPIEVSLAMGGLGVA